MRILIQSMESREILEDALVGFLAGLAVALGGALKDAPYEGFDWKTFLRSPIIGALEAPILAHYFPDADKALIFLSTIGIERLTIELYKVIRAQQAKYIPGKFTTVGEWGNPHWSTTRLTPLTPITPLSPAPARNTRR